MSTSATIAIVFVILACVGVINPFLALVCAGAWWIALRGK